MDDHGIINELGGKYQGLDRYEARKQMVEDLDKLGLLVKIKPHTHNVGTHDRCGTVIEPIISKQWYVKMESLAKPAIEAVRGGKTKFVPERFDKIYFNWMENIQESYTYLNPKIMEYALKYFHNHYLNYLNYQFHCLLLSLYT